MRIEVKRTLFLLKVLLIVGVIAFVCGLLSGIPDISVLTEVGQAKEARYQEWKEQEDENRARQRERARFLRRYENEKQSRPLSTPRDNIGEVGRSPAT